MTVSSSSEGPTNHAMQGHKSNANRPARSSPRILPQRAHSFSGPANPYADREGHSSTVSHGRGPTRPFPVFPFFAYSNECRYAAGRTLPSAITAALCVGGFMSSSLRYSERLGRQAWTSARGLTYCKCVDVTSCQVPTMIQRTLSPVSSQRVG